MRAGYQTLSKRVAQQLKECAAREDKRVIAKLKTQFESELEKFRQVTKSLEQREREILVALSTDGKGACEVKSSSQVRKKISAISRLFRQTRRASLPMQ